MMESKARIVLLAGALACCTLQIRPAAAEEPGPEENSSPLTIRDLTIQGEGASVKGVLLGAPVGTATVDGIKVSLYVLQAASPERLLPHSPTHMFSVTLVEEGSAGVLKDASVSITPHTADDRLQTVNLAPVQAFYRGTVRLDAPGRYNILVSFKAGKREGAWSFPFTNQLGQTSDTAADR
jgi:hypothetical protein